MHVDHMYHDVDHLYVAYFDLFHFVVDDVDYTLTILIMLDPCFDV